MESHVLAAGTAGTSTTGWVVGYTIGIVIVLVVVALVVPILMLARSIGNEAPKINDALTEAVHNTAPLGRAAHHDRARHDHHRRPAARPRQAGRVAMHTLAMSSTEHNLWTIANILGIVVVVAVAALLSLLIYLVKIIDRRVVAVTGHPQGGGGEHRGHRADPAGRHRRRGRPRRGPAAPPVPRSRARKGEVMTGLVIFTVIDVLLLIAGLAFYLFWVGSLLTRIAGNLEECAEIVRTIVGHAKLIGPGVEHINETGGVVAGALPLLYGMAEGIVTGVTPRPEAPAVPEPARPASGTRRSRLLDAVGFRPAD